MDTVTKDKVAAFKKKAEVANQLEALGRKFQECQEVVERAEVIVDDIEAALATLPEEGWWVPKLKRFVGQFEAKLYEAANDASELQSYAENAAKEPLWTDAERKEFFDWDRKNRAQVRRAEREAKKRRAQEQGTEAGG